jgi:hypothetical protein
MSAFGRKQSLLNVRFWPIAAVHDRQLSAKSSHPIPK